MSQVERTCWPVALLGVGISAFGAFLQFKLPPVLPAFLAIYPHSADVAAWFMSIFALVGLLASVPLGRLIERHVLAAALGIGLAIAAIGILIGLAAPQSGWLMLLGRGLEGLTFAIFSVIGPVIANSAVARRDLGLVTGLIAAWIPIGQLLAGFLALAGADWRALWLINLALMVPLVAAAIVYRRWLGPVTRPAGTSLAAGTHPGLLVGAGIFLLWSLQFFAFMTWLTKYLTGELHLSAAAAILAYLTPVVVVMICNIATGWALARGLKLLPALVAALLLQAVVWVSAPWLDGIPGILMLIVFGIGAGVTPACFFHLPHHLEGVQAGPKAYGVLMTGRNSGVFLGPILMAILFQGSLGWSGAAFVIAGISASCALIALTLAARLR
ncbi:MFS transporter [Dongia sp.]|uniref:MFS transporter n=1 Tax=Dongia sp. TaxID=1977262 RepID=UPI0035B41742